MHGCVLYLAPREYTGGEVAADVFRLRPRAPGGMVIPARRDCVTMLS